MNQALHGWRNERNALPTDVKLYYALRDELIVAGDVIFNGSRCVIPKSMRREILHKLHCSHMGVEATLKRARETVFWPHINSDVRNIIESCDACQAYCRRQPRETLRQHDVPEKPWEKVGVDLFTFDHRNYVIIVDYLTNYWEIDYLQDSTTSIAVIKKMKAQFARHGVPLLVFSDNGPQFSTDEFKRFAESWGFAHETASPLYPQSNGKVESAVRTAKDIMKKAKHSNSDAWGAVLEYRNTPSQGLNSSLAQRFFGRRTRGMLPSHPSLLAPASRDVRSQITKMRMRQQQTYDQHAHNLPPLHVGDLVRVHEPGKSQPWRRAVVKNYHGPRSYEIIRDDGQILRTWEPTTTEACEARNSRYRSE